MEDNINNLPETVAEDEFMIGIVDYNEVVFGS